MKKFLVISLFIVTSVLVLREVRVKRPSGPLPEGCLFCHGEVLSPDTSHRISGFGCYSCHLGNQYSLDKKRAHFAMVRNPGDLRVAGRTCGKTGCHPQIITRVKNSIMATNKGILRTIQGHWLNINDSSTGVKDLLGPAAPSNLAIDHYRKLCGGCHLWKARGDRADEIGRRGGGCSDCHVLDSGKKAATSAGAEYHPRMTTRIPSENCVKCHNRSARIGLSYFGKYESAGYGTPYEGKNLSSRRLSGNRFFLNLPSDVHHSRGGMECVDCHTATGLMGDGKEYDKMEEQVDITCRACHSPRFYRVVSPGSLANRLVFLNKKVPDFKDRPIGITAKGTPLYNLQELDGRVIFFRKSDGRALKLNIAGKEKPYHSLPGHERLSCQACHSPWIPQCYGCHLTYQVEGRQRDWITGKESPGRWKEARSYMRFSRPALGLRDPSHIYPVSPCQVFATILGEGKGRPVKRSFKVLTASAFDPHTTSKGSRSCMECHADPKVLGLGEGHLMYKAGKWVFRPTYDSAGSRLPTFFPLDGYIDLEGNPGQATSKDGAGPFNKDELDRILYVNACLGCHNTYSDKIYRDFRGAKRRFETGEDLPCRE